MILQSKAGQEDVKKNCISPKKIIIDSCYSAIIYFATQILVLDYPILVTTSTITFDILKSRKVKNTRHLYRWMYLKSKHLFVLFHFHLGIRHPFSKLYLLSISVELIPKKWTASILTSWTSNSPHRYTILSFNPFNPLQKVKRLRFSNILS